MVYEISKYEVGQKPLYENEARLYQANSIVNVNGFGSLEERIVRCGEEKTTPDSKPDNGGGQGGCGGGKGGCGGQGGCGGGKGGCGGQGDCGGKGGCGGGQEEKK
ncbi:MAG: hypothetical protein ABIG52_00380 [Nanoarchaeota archaeon]|nr:hypothetical protein [Nanoarchaeota archaeon]MBU1643805.1 hypothetical protein [Nanoarchaeota archaeon]